MRGKHIHNVKAKAPGREVQYCTPVHHHQNVAIGTFQEEGTVVTS